ncbi:hypothetical protein MPSEU_001038600 [Mayamaea pseudoterrestris]|nr:hypothetical protein MPSEU_001038600 [Mayamaea pseudoterrestris]
MTHQHTLILICLSIIFHSTQACGNSPNQRVLIQVDATKQSLRCRKVQQNPRQLCSLFDLRSGKRLRQICRDQCRRKCQASIDTTADIVGQARALLPPIPPGPYITTTSNSKVVSLPDPPTPRLVQNTARTNCPHLQTGLKSWHDASIWPNATIPKAGAYVTLPINTKVVVLQKVVEKLGIITVPASSELIIGENLNGISLMAKGMTVKGKLTIGSETCRIETPVTITLWGKRPTNAVQVVPSPSVKGIYVTGTLSLHGKRYFSTWSRLAKTIQAGESVLLLQRPVNWERNQKVILTTSIIYDSRSYHQNEIVTVDRLATTPPTGVGAVVYLQRPVQYKHTANRYYQVEAGLITRTIKIQGASTDSEPTDLDPLNCRTSGYDPWSFYYNMTAPCMGRQQTGYGGHVMVTGTGTAQVEGIQLYRMGQTNVLGRYPMHFHLLGDCPSCYFRDSSIQRSFYRCISVHGTNKATVSENVAFDVTGYCYYLEDGVEEDNTLSFNLAAHIHTIGPDLPTGPSQRTSDYDQTAAVGVELTNPADVAASGFYIPNVHNNIIGNAASGGWAGFAFPVLDTPLGLHKKVMLRPGSANGLTIDGNTAHSTGFWWKHAAGFYLGGTFYYKSDGNLRYSAGRVDFGRGARMPCAIYNDCVGGSCKCREENDRPINITNTKTFLTAGVGLNSWSGMLNVKGFEAHDQRLAIEALSKGFWLDNFYAACRTGQDLGIPSPGSAGNLEGSGFNWYDTTQSHIISNAVFENCGYRSTDYDQYDTSSTRGCGDSSDIAKGCSDTSTTFGFVTHSDSNIPEVMQATKGLTFTDCGRRFRYTVNDHDTVSGRCQNWIDVDGSASGLNEPAFIASGLDSVKDWWGVDDDVVFDEQGPVSFIKKNNGPDRGLASVRFSWDEALHAGTDVDYCFNGDPGPCPIQGYLRHLGYKFSPSQSGAGPGMPVTANPDTTGMVGGYGWVLKLNGGAPRDLNMTEIEVAPNNMLLLSIAYPVGTVFTVTANAESWCKPRDGSISCREVMSAVNSVDLVRNGDGNTYYVDANGVLTMRLFVTRTWTGDPNWLGVPSWNTLTRDNINYAVPRFDRANIKLLNFGYASFRIQASQCGGGSGTFCSGSVSDYDPNVCPSGYRQVAYDSCCSQSNPSQCVFADGTTTN